ncbi:RNA polymerase factor sigma-54 [Thiolapillus brandeum]|uniref:RNA polymerase sigma-54 factor n=1 Tax=Thiolapillus brandeum TaxID=1076588 RepID=A0A7U6GGZ1_9GAMM|nr:RNA polymerase factor sigma-54 [Thiolapillus brandeum]BAO43379.1 DNA-directed RNA polymerase sigma-54 factor [Thiolapillus brandeum]
MKPSIQLRLGQNLTMTPQLQQAIRLLQLSTLELKQEIQEALESNLMLEIEEDGQAGLSQETTPDTNDNSPDSPAEPLGVEGSQDTIPEELPVDANWEDQYDIPVTRTQQGSSEESADFLARESHAETLQDYLHWQLNLTPFSPQDRGIAMAIIDGIAPDGYLKVPLEDILIDMQDEEIGMEEVLTVLHRVQHFDPPGIAARDPRECLLLQLEQLPDQPLKPQAEKLLRDHFELVTGNNEAHIRKQLRINSEEVRQVFRLIRSLNPYPGSSISPPDTRYVEPDVFVQKKNGRWLVSLNPDTMPRLRVNPEYAGLVKRADNSSDNVTLKDHLQEARWFLKSLQGRNQTLLKVATRIVEVQQGFFEHGEEAMKPLILKDIAEAVDMHESTISRITTGKYMHTPRGVLEFKYFFSSHVSTDNGDQASATAIRAHIRKLILAEDPKKPLSDNKIATMLSNDGIKVARRTVAKYREAMAIPPSNERKRLV